MQATYKIVINPKFEPIRQYIESIPHRNEELGEVLYRGRNTVFRNKENDFDLTIKSFKIPPFYNKIAYTYLRKSKARRSYENAIKLLEMGINTPAPIAYIEVYKSHLLERSYYVCEMLDAADVRWWAAIPNNDFIVEGVAKLMAKLHTHGVYHKDFSPGNILYDKNHDFYLIDINRMEFGITDRHKLIQNFKRIDESAGEIARLVHVYSMNSMVADEKGLLGEALKVHKKFWEGEYRKRRIKKLFKSKKR